MKDSELIIENEKKDTLLEVFEVPRSSNEDTVNNYKIHLNEEIHELSNDFCKYYYAYDDNNPKCFAIVYNQDFVAPIKIIDFLHKNHIHGLNHILDWSITHISTTSMEQLVVIVESYDYMSNLHTYVQQQGTINLNFAENIIKSLNQVIDFLAQNGIFGCNITTSNILIKNDKFLVLREFIDSYPYFYINDQYIAPELLECHEAARKTHSYKPDIYAMSISIFHAYFGKAPWLDYNRTQEYNEIRLEHGTYKYLLGKLKIPENLRIFFRLTLSDDSQVRWKTQNITDWLNGKANKTVHDSIIDNKYTIGFNDKNYSNIKSLAYALFRFWEPAIKFIKDNKLFKWANKQQISSDMLESIKHIVDINPSMISGINNAPHSNHKLSKLLSIIDPSGGIRGENIALSPDSIPEFLQYLSVSKKKATCEQVIKIVKEQLWIQYSNIDAIGHLAKPKADHYVNIFANINLNSFYRGIERLVYFLNPNLPCLSHVTGGKYITNIKDLLISADKNAQKNPKSFNLDKQFIAFMSAKLNLKEDLPAVVLSNFPKFAEHPTIRNLSVLNLLQLHEPSIKLPAVCKSIVYDLNKLFEEYLHNIEFKKTIIDSLNKAANSGDLADIISVLNDQQQFINDYNGYYEACKKAKLIEDQIKILSNQEEIFNNALIFGQKVTVLISYIMCFIVSVTIML